MNKIIFNCETIKPQYFNYEFQDSNSIDLRGKIVYYNIIGFNELETYFNSIGVSICADIKLSDSIYIFGLFTETAESDEIYYTIIDYYFEQLQSIIKYLINKKSSGQIIVLIPDKNKCKNIIRQSALYSIEGLIKGISIKYAEHGIFINAMIHNEEFENKIDVLRFLMTKNSYNIIGQIF